MVISRALGDDNQVFRRPGGLINRTFKWNIFAFESQILFWTNMYHSWFRYRRYWIQCWFVAGDDPLLATSLYPKSL